MDNKTIAAYARLKDFLEKISVVSLGTEGTSDSGASDNIIKKLLSINSGLKNLMIQIPRKNLLVQKL